MWLPEPRLLRSTAIACALVGAMAAGGCNVQPLYATSPVTGQGMTAALSDVDVSPVEGRVGQKVRNDLLFYMNGGDAGGGTYLVDLTVRERYANIITRSISGLPGGRNIRLTVNYSLRKVGDGEVLTSGTVTRIASFDYFNQRFANDRATIDAENRAAQEAAADIHLRLASYFATGKSFDDVAPPDTLNDGLPGFGNAVFDDQDNVYGEPNL